MTRAEAERLVDRMMAAREAMDYALARQTVVQAMVTDDAALAPESGQGVVEHLDLARNPRTGDFVWCKCGDAVRCDDVLCGNCACGRGIEARPPPAPSSPSSAQGEGCARCGGTGRVLGGPCSTCAGGGA